MKALTIRQPWAGAVALGWKPVENRTRMFSHRGPTLIHAGQQVADDIAGALATIRATDQEIPDFGLPGEAPAWAFGSIVAVADLHSAHRGCDGSCAPGWAQRGLVHHMVRDVQLLTRPVPAPGRLGLWTPDPDVLDAVKEALPR